MTRKLLELERGVRRLRTLLGLGVVLELGLSPLVEFRGLGLGLAAAVLPSRSALSSDHGDEVMEMAVGVVEATTEGMRPPTAADRPGLLLLLLLRWRRRSLLSLETLAATMPSAPALAPVKSAGG